MAFHLDLRHPVDTTRETGSALARWLRDRAPGLLLALAVAAAATAAGTALPVVGGPVFGIVFGLLVAVVVRPGPRTRQGIGFASRPVLQISIVVLGATLSLSQIADVGLGSLPVMLGTLAVALAGAFVVGRLLGVRGDTQLLIGVGTAICGASAIAATQSVIRAKESQVAYAVATIFVFNVAAVLTFPQLGHLMGLDPHAFGLWAGTAVNDTSSVVAAGYAYGGDAGSYAVIVKLTRTLMIIPIVVALAMWAARRDAVTTAGSTGGAGRRPLPWRKLVPLFLVGFVVTSALTSIGVIPAAWHPALTAVGTFLITTALAGIGLSMQTSEIRHAGIRPLLLGAVLWVLVAASSLGLQALTGTL